MEEIRRIFVEKKKGFDVEASSLLRDLKENLGIKGLTDVRVLNRYDISGITEEEYRIARKTILSEPPVDMIYEEEIKTEKSEKEILYPWSYFQGHVDHPDHHNQDQERRDVFKRVEPAGPDHRDAEQGDNPAEKHLVDRQQRMNESPCGQGKGRHGYRPGGELAH